MTMTIERLREIIEAYGGDPRRWPITERRSAQDLAAREPEAAALLAEAEALDGLLAGATAPEPGFELRQAVLAAAPRAQPPRLLHISRLGWLSGAGWAAAAAAGVVLGVSVGQQVLTDWQVVSAVEQAAAWSLDETEYLG